MKVPHGYNAYYYKSFPLNKLVPGVSRMEQEEFDSLTESIEKEGMLNPIIIEFEPPEYIVIVGHNRCEVVKQLGWQNVEAVVLTRIRSEILDGAEVIPSEEFLRTMKSRHPHDDTWTQSAWALRVLKRARQV